MNSYLPYVIPMLTFLLGSGLTLALKRYDKRNSSLAIYARDLSDSANDWYNQLYEILHAERSTQEFEKRAQFYERNRLVLPKYLRALEALRKHRKAHRLVAEAEQFLSTVTVANRQSTSTYECRVCAALFDRSDRLGSSQSDGLVLSDTFVEILDRQIQSINAEAGKIL